MKSTCRAGIFLLLTGLIFAAVADARTVTIYRIQLGAYQTQAEAEAKKLSAETEGFEPVYIVQKDGDFPWKVMTGDFPEYDGAKTKSDEYKQAGMNEGRGFVTQVEMAKEEAESKSLPIPKAALDNAVKQIARANSSEGEAARLTSSFRLQVGDAGPMEEKMKLRTYLWFKGEESVYIKCYGEVCALVVGDYGTSNDAITDASRIQEILPEGTFSVSAADPSDNLMDVTQNRTEEDLFNAVKKVHPAGDQNQWINIDAGLQFLEQHPDSSRRDEVHFMIGVRLYQLFWQQQRDESKISGNLQLLRSAAEHYEKIVQEHPESPFVGKAKYELGVIHQRFSKYGLNLEELWKSQMLIEDASNENALDEYAKLHQFGFFFERARTQRNLLPEAASKMEQYISENPDMHGYVSSRIKLMLGEISVLLEDFETAREWFERLMNEEISDEARQARYFGMYMLANDYYRHHKKAHKEAIPILEQIVAECRPEDSMSFTHTMGVGEYRVTVEDEGALMRSKYVLADCYAAVGKRREAVAMLRQYCEECPPSLNTRRAAKRLELLEKAIWR